MSGTISIRPAARPEDRVAFIRDIAGTLYIHVMSGLPPIQQAASRLTRAEARHLATEILRLTEEEGA